MNTNSPHPPSLVVIDVETTGTNPFLHDPVSIALVPVQEAMASLSIMICPADPVWSTYAAENFRNFEDDWRRDALSPSEAVILIEQYLQRTFGDRAATLVGHNISFDLGFLRKLAFQSGKDDLLGVAHRSIDTHSLLHFAWTIGKVPEDALSSDGAFRYFDIDIAPRARHTALGDAQATRALYLRICSLLGESILGEAWDVQERWLTGR